MERKLRIIISHDIDWSPNGPGVNHVLARKERFDEEIISKVIEEGFNPYNGISELMDLEKSVGVRSTFFFRPKYDDGILIDDYRDTIKALSGGGWEIGAHLNDATNIGSIVKEKEAIESVAGKILGSRVHYLKVNDSSLFEAAGFAYDSSSMFRRDAIDTKNMGFFSHGKLIVFPITIMDTYLFSYMHVKEENVIATIEKAANLAVEHGFMTLLWHDCSLRMKGGRVYPRVVESLASRENTTLVRGMDAYNLVARAGKS